MYVYDNLISLCRLPQFNNFSNNQIIALLNNVRNLCIKKKN